LARRGSNNHKQKIIEKKTWILVVQSVLNLSNLIVKFPQQSVVMFFILNVLCIGFKLDKIRVMLRIWIKILNGLATIVPNAEKSVQTMNLSKHISIWKPKQQV
jgi:hypothetical protein